MSTNAIRFRCPRCGGHIKAPVRLMGRSQDCPGCGQAFVVPRAMPQRGSAILVLLEGTDRFSLGIAYPGSA
jgi:hypothetical protein